MISFVSLFLFLALSYRIVIGESVVDQYTNVALNKPVLEVFSGDGTNVTLMNINDSIGWFSTAFSDFPDHTLYPETILIDLLDVYNISAIAFISSPIPPKNFTLSISLPGSNSYTLVNMSPSLTFSPTLAQYVRLVVASVDAPTDAPNFTIAVGRLQILGQPNPIPKNLTPDITWPPSLPPPIQSYPSMLLTERKTNPIDIDTHNPLLSWILSSNRQGDTITAWQVQVNDTLNTILMDTGIVNGTAFSVLATPNKPFMSGDSLRWSVRLWDMNGIATPWASIATFSIAKLNKTDWKSQWIGANSSLVVPGIYGPGHPAIYLRGVFNLTNLPIRAIASFSGLGYGKLLIDGAPVSNYELSPGYTTYEYRVQYNVFDITLLLQKTGIITVAAILGDGWYSLAHDPSCCAHFQNQRYVNSTRMLLDIDLWFTDGSHITLGSNDLSWQWALGEITSSWFAGESIDKRLALPTNWTTTFTKSIKDNLNAPLWGIWRPVVILDGPTDIFNTSKLTSQKEPPTISQGTIIPQTLRIVSEPNSTLGGQVYIFDLGREIQGRVIVNASSISSALVRIILCGSLYISTASDAVFSCNETTIPQINAGSGPSLYNFTLAGTSNFEIYKPTFTYTGFRRVIVHAPEGVIINSLLGEIIAMNQPISGTFTSSSDTYNWLHSSLARTQLHYCTGFPNDPTRERVGYTQDVMNMFRGAAFEFQSSELMYSRWLADMADGQQDAYLHPGNGIPPGPGQMPTVIPGPKSDNANSVFWGGMIVWLPWRHYLHYGDIRVLQNYYSNMVAYVEYLNVSASNYTVDWGLSDWNSPLPECSGWGYHAAPIINSPGLYLLSNALSSIADFLGNMDDANRFKILANTTASVYNAAYLNITSGVYSQGQQCHQAMALAMDGLVPSSDIRSAAATVLVERILADNSTLTVGFVSFLHEVLAMADIDASIMHNAITRRNYGPNAFSNFCADKDRPGGHVTTAYGCAPGPYAMSVGAIPSNDIMKETWQGGDALMPSLAGPLLLHSYHTIGGLRTAEILSGAGFKNFSILPSVVPGILWANTSYTSPLGTISSNWFVVEKTLSFYLEVVIPPGAKCLIGIPSVEDMKLFESGRIVTNARWENGRSYVLVDSGIYYFNSTIAKGIKKL
jgi:alpha-L-rhamnosidase